MPRISVLTAALLAATALGAGFLAAELFRAPLVPARVAQGPAPQPSPRMEVPALSGKALRDTLRKGGYVLYFRHASRTETRTVAAFDAALVRDPAFVPGEAPPGTCLNDEGKGEARLLGHAVKALAVPVGKVLASPTCRARQSAELAFGRVEVHPFLGYKLMFAEAERKHAGEQLVRLLNTPPAPGTNTFLFSHSNNLEHVGLNVQLDQAEAAVFAPQAGAAPRLVAKIPLLEWVYLQPIAAGLGN